MTFILPSPADTLNPFFLKFLKYINIYLFLYFIALGLRCGMWHLFPWSGMETGPPALGVWSLSPGTTREGSQSFLDQIIHLHLRPCATSSSLKFPSSLVFWLHPSLLHLPLWLFPLWLCPSLLHSLGPSALGPEVWYFDFTLWVLPGQYLGFYFHLYAA